MTVGGCWLQTYQIGHGNWQQIQTYIRNSRRFQFNYFIRSRTTRELKARTEFLMRSMARDMAQLYKKDAGKKDLEVQRQEERAKLDEAMAAVQVRTSQGPMLCCAVLRCAALCCTVLCCVVLCCDRGGIDVCVSCVCVSCVCVCVCVCVYHVMCRRRSGCSRRSRPVLRRSDLAGHARQAGRAT